MIYHHLVASPYSERFIQFIIDNSDSFNIDEHCFLIYQPVRSTFRVTIKGQCNYKAFPNSWDFVKAHVLISKNNRIIIHGLFNPIFLAYLFVRRKLIKQCTWSIWGDDVYFYRNKNKSFKMQVLEFIRKSVIPQIPIITSFIKGDFETVKMVYGSRAFYLYSLSPTPLDFSSIHIHQRIKSSHDGLVVLLGNSGDPANNHIEVLDSLARFKDENIIIITPLSYGNKSYIQLITNYGKQIFGTKFIVLSEFMHTDEYAKLLASVDIAIMNHAYQQGLGNILALLAMGKKVFVRSDTTTHNFFNQKGIIVFDTIDLLKMSFNAIIEFDPNIGIENALKLQHEFSEDKTTSSWQEVFNKH